MVHKYKRAIWVAIFFLTLFVATAEAVKGDKRLIKTLTLENASFFSNIYDIPLTEPFGRPENTANLEYSVSKVLNAFYQIWDDA